MTDRLDLIPATAEDLRQLLDDVPGFERRRKWRVVPGYLEDDGAVLGFFIAMLEAGVPPEWATHLVVHVADAAVVGAAGFKGEPQDGAVEIGYGIAPAYRSRGLATEAAGILVRRATARGVATVVAETLAETNHSTAVLTRLGFVRVGDARVTDDGPVWRWELDLASRPAVSVPRP